MPFDVDPKLAPIFILTVLNHYKFKSHAHCVVQWERDGLF